MLDYDSTMRAGAARYQDVLDALRVAGLPATFTQTGGMCAALEVMLDSGHTLLITDAEDSARDRGAGGGAADGARHGGLSTARSLSRRLALQAWKIACSRRHPLPCPTSRAAR